MATPLSCPCRAQVLSLFRSFLRTSTKFSDYNLKAYSKRRTIDGFRSNRTLSDPSAVSSAFNDGKYQLEAVARQASVYSLYAAEVKSIMEIKIE